MRPVRGLVHIDAKLSDAVARLQITGETCLVVLDGDEVVGVLPRHVVLQAIGGASASELSDLMLPPSVYCRADDNLEAIVKAMREQGRLHALVLDADDQLLGLLDAEALELDGETLGLDVAEAAEHEMRECGHSDDPAGNRALDAPSGDLQVYSERPHLKPERWQ